MAEIGLIASILAIAGAGAKISLGLYEFASDIGSAGKEVRFIARDTNAFSQALTSLSQVLNGGTASSERARLIVGDLIVLCRDILDDSAMLLKVLQPLVKLSGSHRNRLVLRIRWLFEKSKFVFHRQSLESLKATLTLLVSTITYVDASSSNVPEAISTSLRLQLESIREEVQLNNREYRQVCRMLQDNTRHEREILLVESPSPGSNSELNKTAVESLSICNRPSQPTEDQENSARPSSIDRVAAEDPVPENPLILHSSDAEGEIVSDQAMLEELGMTSNALVPYIGLPYLQQQALHLADDVLDGTEDLPQERSNGRRSITSGPADRETHHWRDGFSLGGWSASSGSDAERRRRRDKALREAYGKIAFRDFKKGDLALFLPTKNCKPGTWAAFNVGAPHYFLRPEARHSLDQREWLLGRITKVEEHVVKDEAETDDGGNPFDLSDGLRWWMLDAVEGQPRAPSTPGLGKSTVGSSYVYAITFNLKKGPLADSVTSLLGGSFPKNARSHSDSKAQAQLGSILRRR